MVAISIRFYRCVECPSWRFCYVNDEGVWGKCGQPWSKFYKEKVEAQDSQCGYMLRGVRGRGEGKEKKGEEVRYKVEQKAAREYKVEGEGMMRTEREEMEAAQEDEANIITRSPSTLGGLSPIMFVRYAVYHGKDFTLLDVVRWLIRMRENTVIIVALEHGMFNIRVGERSWNGTSSPLMDLCVWIKDHWVHYASVTPREDCREYRAH